jgi:hypothetical protein
MSSRGLAPECASRIDCESIGGALHLPLRAGARREWTRNGQHQGIGRSVDALLYRLARATAARKIHGDLPQTWLARRNFSRRHQRCTGNDQNHWPNPSPRRLRHQQNRGDLGPASDRVFATWSPACSVAASTEPSGSPPEHKAASDLLKAPARLCVDRAVNSRGAGRSGCATTSSRCCRMPALPDGKCGR